MRRAVRNGIRMYGERNVWKITPFKNLIELNDIPSKRRYYDTQITGD